MSSNFPWPDVVENLAESRRVEYKKEDSLFHPGHPGLRRAVLAMANREDGGFVVVGVDEPSPKEYVAKGLQSKKLPDLANLQITLAKSGSPNIDLDVTLQKWNEKKFVLIVVRPSHEKPVISICDAIADGRDEPGKAVRAGVIYWRTTGPTSEPITAAGWDELWARFASIMRSQGQKELLAAWGSTPPPIPPTDLRQFDEEARDIQ